MITRFIVRMERNAAQYYFREISGARLERPLSAIKNSCGPGVALLYSLILVYLSSIKLRKVNKRHREGQMRPHTTVVRAAVGRMG